MSLESEGLTAEAESGEMDTRKQGDLLVDPKLRQHLLHIQKLRFGFFKLPAMLHDNDAPKRYLLDRRCRYSYLIAPLTTRRNV